jgi:SH3-like domain-containing protein
MLQRLLSDARTAIVTGTEPRPIHEAPEEGSRIRYLAEPGVVGRLSKCENNWCRFEVGGRDGYMQAAHFWGTDANEKLD